jgi:hypothetical protein
MWRRGRIPPFGGDPLKLLAGNLRVKAVAEHERMTAKIPTARSGLSCHDTPALLSNSLCLTRLLGASAIATKTTSIRAANILRSGSTSATTRSF